MISAALLGPKACSMPITDDQELRGILDDALSVAVVGLSDQEDHSSHGIAEFLHDRGYLITPVNPNITEFRATPAVASLAEIEGPIDIVNVFRRPEFAPEVARAAEAAGAEAVVVANTILGIAIDAETRRPLLGSVTGGLSGPAIRPIILRMVYQCARSISIPIIASGGIETAPHVIEFMLAGATAAQVGTASFIHPIAMVSVIDGLIEYCERHEITHVADLIGAMEHTEVDPILLTPIGS